MRPDRDEYIKIKTENIEDYDAHNKILFDVMGDASTFNVDYDGNSIMHYTSRYMSKKSGMDTMVSKVGLLQFENFIFLLFSTINVTCHQTTFFHGN